MKVVSNETRLPSPCVDKLLSELPLNHVNKWIDEFCSNLEIELPTSPLDNFDNFNILELCSEQSSPILEPTLTPHNYTHVAEFDNTFVAVQQPPPTYLQSCYNEAYSSSQSYVYNSISYQDTSSNTIDSNCAGPINAKSKKRFNNNNEIHTLEAGPIKKFLTTEEEKLNIRRKQNNESDTRKRKQVEKNFCNYQHNDIVVNGIKQFLMADLNDLDNSTLREKIIIWLNIIETYVYWKKNTYAKFSSTSDPKARANLSKQKERNHKKVMQNSHQENDAKMNELINLLKRPEVTTDQMVLNLATNVLTKLQDYQWYLKKVRVNSKLLQPKSSEPSTFIKCLTMQSNWHIVLPTNQFLETLWHQLCGPLPFNAYTRSLSSAIDLHSVKKLKMAKVDNDGNCGYRALSFILSGSQEHHKIVRQKICTAICNNELPLEYYYFCGNAKQDALNKMFVNSAIDPQYWMNENDIIALSCILSINIIVYANYNKCLLHNCTIFNPFNQVTFIDAPTIMLVFNDNHFEPVIEYFT